MATNAVANGEKFHLDSGDGDLICPTCDVKIKVNQVADHCQVEVERLHRMQLRSATIEHNTTTAVSNASSAADTTASATTTTTAAAAAASADAGSRRVPYSVFQRVQRNRHARQRQRTRKRPSSSLAPAPPTQPTEPACPVCNKHFPQSEIQQHANQCLRSSRRNGHSNGNHSSEDGEDSDEYEEYEWAGQKRVRVSTLVQGGLSNILGQTIKYNGNQQTNDDEDEDLNVDEDDTHIYGPTQYSESDVIPLVNDDSDEDVSEADVANYMRRLISSNTNTTPKTKHSTEAEIDSSKQRQQNLPPPADEQQQQQEQHPEPSTSQTASTSKSNNKPTQSQNQIIESLKTKLRMYELQAQSKLKCLICIDDYKNPAISVSCWHVHCEQCWLQTLGARKLCPQCNSITTPKDLRRIYL